jgi:hypothetical protein
VATELPIACSLSAAEMPARLAEMAKIGAASLLATIDGPEGAEPIIEELVRAFAA